MGLLCLVWLLNLLQLRKASRDTRFHVKRDRYDGPAPGDPLISVIVPARNEERNIGDCLNALSHSDHTNTEVIVVDDRSDDGTGTLLTRYRVHMHSLRVIAGEGPAEGWMGKIAAVWRGQQDAKGEHLLFLDADVRVDPAAIRQCIHYIKDQGVDGVSVIGFLDNHGFWEHVVQPVVGSLVLSGNRPERVNDPKLKDAMANGQFILVSREAYDAVGGHEAIKGEVMDDVAFARLMKSNGRKLHLVLGNELFECRMYHGLLEVWNGWSKNLFPGLHHSLGLTAVVVSLVFATAFVPFLTLAALGLAGALAPPLTPLAALTSATCALAYATYAYGLHLVRQPARWFWSYPIGVAVLLCILINSAVRIRWGFGVTWKGRKLLDTGTGGPKVRPSEQEPGAS